MMKNIQYLLLAMALLVSAASIAQDNRLTLGLNYSVAVPQGDSKDLVSKTSYLGFSAELMYHFNNQFSLGLESGSQAFYQKYPRQLYKTTDGGDLSAVVSNNIETVPIMLKGHYSLLPESAVQPFVSLAAGGNIITYNQY
ncbi:MAG TPA: outer membrane beta-barrel protein, partial [Chitinophagaceae bacterium]|nr:outer membrane beta-barrel protein [Chitinophagaceae bacterium]